MTGQMEAGTSESRAVTKPLRGKWTEQQRRRIVVDSRVAGASIQEVAQRHGVRPNLLSAWRRRGKPKVSAKAAQLAAVRVITALPVREGSIEIDFNSGCVRVRGVVDGGMLRDVLAATR